MLDPCAGTPSLRKATGDAVECRWASGWQEYLSRPMNATHPYAVPGASLRLAELAPTLVLVGEDDAMRDEALRFAQRLQRCRHPGDQQRAARGRELARGAVRPRRSAIARACEAVGAEALARVLQPPRRRRPPPPALGPRRLTPVTPFAADRLRSRRLCPRAAMISAFLLSTHRRVALVHPKSHPKGRSSCKRNKLSSLTRRGLWPAVTGLTAAAGDRVPPRSACRASSAEANNAPAVSAPRATPVSVATVAATEVNTWDEFSGRLEAVERVDVRSRVAGAVQAVHFREGALVKQGDLLVTIDPAPYAAEVDRAEAQVAAAQARVVLHAQRAGARAAACGTRRPSPSASSTSASTPAARPKPTCAPRRPRCRPRA